MADLKLDISAMAPMERLGVAILEYCATHRETMSQTNRDRADTLSLDIWEAIFKPLLKAAK
jgi:hypothetical protein